MALTREYIAGLFDGEGSVGLYWSKTRGCFVPRIVIEMKHETRNIQVLSEISKMYGTKVYLGKGICRFRLESFTKLTRFIDDMVDVSRIKTTQLLLLSSWIETRTYGFRISQLLKIHKRRA